MNVTTDRAVIQYLDFDNDLVFVVFEYSDSGTFYTGVALSGARSHEDVEAAIRFACKGPNGEENQTEIVWPED